MRTAANTTNDDDVQQPGRDPEIALMKLRTSIIPISENKAPVPALRGSASG